MHGKPSILFRNEMNKMSCKFKTEKKHLSVHLSESNII